MNWLFYIGGYPLWLGITLNFWDIESQVKDKSYGVAVLKIVSVTILWIWICWIETHIIRRVL